MAINIPGGGLILTLPVKSENSVLKNCITFLWIFESIRPGYRAGIKLGIGKFLYITKDRNSLR